MSGETVPYRLRPHKAVDRRLFMALLSRCERWLDLGDHVYASMGAYSLEDHKLVHRLLGIRRLFAFDMNAEVVARQKFNRPAEECKCVALTSGDFVADIESAVAAAGIDDAEGYVVWLDYTAPKEIPQQIREFQKLVGQLAEGDIVRITTNAEFNYWGGKSIQDGKAVPIEKRQAVALARLGKSLAEYMPPGVEADALDAEGVATVLAKAFGIAAFKGLPAAGGTLLEPVSVTRYADGQQMLSLTGVVVPVAKREDMRRALGLGNWPFASAAWGDVKALIVPDLTIRERLFLERHASKSAEFIKKSVGFDFDTVTEMDGFLDNFRNYFRHYPALTPVEF